MSDLYRAFECWREGDKVPDHFEIKNFSELSSRTGLVALENNSKYIIKNIDGPNSIFQDIEKFSKVFQNSTCRVLGKVEFDYRLYIIFEYIEGQSIYQLWKNRDKDSFDEFPALALNLVAKFDKKAEDSSDEELIAEVNQLETRLLDVQKRGLFNQVDVTQLCALLLDLARGSFNKARWTCGDFTAQNIIEDPLGKYVIVDIEHVHKTHFFHEDLVRFFSFSGIELPSTSFIDYVGGQRRWDCLTLFVWLRQILLESRRANKRDFSRCVAHNLYKISELVLKYGSYISFSSLWNTIEFSNELVTTRDDQLEKKDILLKSETSRLIQERNELLLEKDLLYQAEINRIGVEREKLLKGQRVAFEEEIQRLVGERERLLSDKDIAYRAEIERIGEERDKMLSDQGQAFRAEIARLVDERDSLLHEKDLVYQSEIKRVAAERDSMLANQEKAYQTEIDRLVKEREQLLRRQRDTLQYEFNLILSKHQTELLLRERREIENIEELKKQFSTQLAAKDSESELVFEETQSKYAKLLPEIAIIIVDYNGSHFLRELFPALVRQSYQNFKIFIVLNGEFEDSLSVISDFESSLRFEVIKMNDNSGFCGGNNAAFKYIDSEFAVLLNNDTIPDPDWLYYLYGKISEDSQIAAVTSKLLFVQQYFEIGFSSRSVCPKSLGESDDGRDLGVCVNFTDEEGNEIEVIPKEGFYSEENMGGETWRWTTGRSLAWIPCKPGETVCINYRMHPELLGTMVEFTVGLNNHQVRTGIETGKFKYTPELTQVFDVINNAGSYIKDEKEIGDIGIFQKDSGEFDQAGEVDAICACSVILRISALNGELFPETFFAYFEDTDLSLRLRRDGYKLFYEPRSRVRHAHSGTMGSKSSFFYFHVYRNYRWLLVRNLKSIWSVFGLFIEEIKNFKTPVGGLNVTYNTARLKKETLKGMLKEFARRYLK